MTQVTIPTWQERAAENSILGKTRDVRVAMQSEIDELRAALQAAAMKRVSDLGQELQPEEFVAALQAAPAQPVNQMLVDAFDAAVESARLLGSTQANKSHGCYTETDAVFERSMYQSIAKHRRTVKKDIQ